jgi:hypothetical protein
LFKICGGEFQQVSLVFLWSEVHVQWLIWDFMNLLRFWRIFLIDSASAKTIDLSLQEITSKPEAQASGVGQSAESVHQWLSCVECDWLMIFDNADGDPCIVTKYMPMGNQDNILFTS